MTTKTTTTSTTTTTTTQREARRNRLLRRVDWRFLLPDPAPDRSVCFAEGSLSEAVRLISGQVDLPGAAAPDTCDLAVAIDPDVDTLHRARDVLRPGGALYVEWHRRADPKRARRLVEAAGFQIVARYWPWPHPASASPKCWVPLDAPGIRRFFQRTPAFSFIPGRAGIRAPVLALHRLRMLVLRAIPVPVCMVARKPPPPATADPDARRHLPADELAGELAGEPHSSPMPEGLQSLIREHWPEPEVGHPPDTFSWLLLTTGARTISKVVGLVFADAQDAPGTVVKMPRVPEAVPALKREAETLDAIHASHPRPVDGVPRVLFYERNAGMVALAETVVTGVPLWVKLRRGTYRMLALRVTDWLAEFAGRTEPLPRSAWGDRLVDTTMRTFTSQFAPVLDAEKIRKTEEALDQLDALPMVCEQRDFGPWNVLVAPDGALGVLDWESAELRGLPALDLIYFLSFQAFFHDRTMRSRRFRPSYRTLLDASTFTGSIHAECMVRYVERVDIELRLLHPLRLLCWMIHAGSDYRHLAADVAGDPGAADLRRSAFLGLWEEELAHGRRSRMHVLPMTSIHDRSDEHDE